MVEKKDFTPADASNAWLKAAAHDYVATEVPATCTENAKTVKVCKNCADEVKVEKLNTKLGHDYKVKETAVDGNCVNGVTYTVVCTRCKTDKTPQFTTSDKDGTRYFTGFQGEPTLTPGNYIKVPANKASADHKLGKQEKIADATCEHGELVAQKCTVCHKVDPTTIVEVSKAKDHTLEEVVTPETCQNTKKVETKCKVCGTVVKTVGGLEKADKKACVYDAWKVVKNPTLFEEGMKKTACSVCGQLEKDGSSIAIPKLTLAKPKVNLTSTKGRMTVKASAANATGYKVTYKRYGKKATTKTYTAESISKTYRLLKGKKYTVTVTAFASNGTETVTSAAATKTITIKK